MIALLKLQVGIALKTNGEGNSIKWAEFCAMICCSLYIKGDMVRGIDLNNFVGSGKHLEET